MQLLLVGNQHYIRMSDIQSVLELADRPFTQCVSRYEYEQRSLEQKEINAELAIPCKKALRLLSWYLGNSNEPLPDVVNFKHSLKKYGKPKPKRTLSRSMRIEIAFRQQYKCHHCQLFPIPPTFEVDHIVELQDGGQDIASNLQALCPQCHREKSRLNRLRKSSIFKEDVMHDYQQFLQPLPQPPLPQPPLPPTVDSGQVFSKYFSKSVF